MSQKDTMAQSDQNTIDNQSTGTNMKLQPIKDISYNLGSNINFKDYKETQEHQQQIQPSPISDKQQELQQFSNNQQSEPFSQRIVSDQPTPQKKNSAHVPNITNSRLSLKHLIKSGSGYNDQNSANPPGNGGLEDKKIADTIPNALSTTSTERLSEPPQRNTGRKVWAIVRQAMMNQLKNLRDSWIQLAGHKGCFLKGSTPDTILKRLSGQEENCFDKLKCDELAEFVPKVKRKIIQGGEAFLEMQDLLASFESASVMDIKMGCRTYCEDELSKAYKDQKMRSDMYEKMIEVDQSEPTPEENKLKAITKPRYMIWRESISSSANLGFRIEGMRLGDGTVDKEFKTIKSEEQVAEALMRFTQNNTKARRLYLRRLLDLKSALEKSHFFTTHELIGSSLLFVHDQTDASIWLIDFAKTHTLPDDIKITHYSKWEIGNHEDGYMIGVDNLIKIFGQLCASGSRPTKELDGCAPDTNFLSNGIAPASDSTPTKLNNNSVNSNISNNNNNINMTTVDQHPLY